VINELPSVTRAAELAQAWPPDERDCSGGRRCSDICQQIDRLIPLKLSMWHSPCRNPFWLRQIKYWNWAPEV